MAAPGWRRVPTDAVVERSKDTLVYPDVLYDFATYGPPPKRERPVPRRSTGHALPGERAQTPADIAGQLGLPPSDIETLSGLPTGYLSDYSCVVLLPQPDKLLAKSDRAREGAQVIDLPRRSHVDDPARRARLTDRGQTPPS